jgi:hypothetical protein
MARLYKSTKVFIATRDLLNIFEAVSTNVTSFFNYVLDTFIDEHPGTPINGLLYQNTVLTDCFVYSLGFASHRLKIKYAQQLFLYKLTGDIGKYLV